MTTSTHLRQLPTLQPGDSHSESLIEAAIQGHADTREAMRWLVRQLVPATQPAEVTRDEVMQAAKEATAPEWQDVVDGWHMGLDLMAFAHAILALRPVQVPMTGETTKLPDGKTWFYCVTHVTSVQGWQRWRVAASSLDEAQAKFATEGGEFDSEELEVMDFNSPEWERHHGITAPAKKEDA